MGVGVCTEITVGLTGQFVTLRFYCIACCF